MTTAMMFKSTLISLKIIQPIVISAFTVFVLAASFLVGQHVGYTQGVEHSQAQQITSMD